MSDHLIADEGLLKRLRWLMFFRVVIITFLLGIAAFVQIKGTKSLPGPSLYSLYYIIIITYFLTFIYLLFLKITGHVRFNIYLQTLCDAVLATGLVYATGGIESIYTAFYPLVVIYSVLFLERKGGLIIASACGILYGLLLDFEYYGLIHPIYPEGWIYSYGAGQVFARIFIHIVSFYIVALLTSFVVVNEKKLRLLLAERESAFNQLDLLHRSIIESVDTGILTFDLLREVKSFNRAAEEITGYRFQAVRDRRIEELFPGISRFLNQTGKNDLRRDTRNRFELIVENKEKGQVILGFAFSPLSGSGGEKIGDILIFQDLTSLKEMEREMEKNRRLALIGEMTACFAHEMRNPLASISGSIQMLRRELKLSQTDERLMQIVLRGKDQLETLLRDLLLLARPRAGQREEVALPDVVGDVVESLRYSHDWSGDVETSVELGGDGKVFGNKSEIRQALWNLALNGLQSMEDGGKLTIRTRSVWDGGTAYVEIEVADQGCGIGDGDMAKIFEPFYTTKEKGSGLGLAIVNRIADSHGGKISVERVPGEGTRFTLRLPRGVASP